MREAVQERLDRMLFFVQVPGDASSSFRPILGNAVNTPNLAYQAVLPDRSICQPQTSFHGVVSKSYSRSSWSSRSTVPFLLCFPILTVLGEVYWSLKTLLSRVGDGVSAAQITMANCPFIWSILQKSEDDASGPECDIHLIKCLHGDDHLDLHPHKKS